MNLQEIKLAIKAKEAKIQQLQEEISDFKKIKLEIETGFKEGDMVESGTGQRGILKFNGEWPSAWHWRKLKKDGTQRPVATYLGNNFKKING